MLKLTHEGIQEKKGWEEKGIALPGYCVSDMVKKTTENPRWLHLGAGNIFRGYVADLQHSMLNQGKADTGIIAAESYDEEIIERIYAPYDNLTLLVVMKGDGSFDKRVVSSLSEGLVADPARGADWNRLVEIFKKPSLQMVSFTITEKGYSLQKISGELMDIVVQDISEGPKAPRHAMARACALLLERYKNGALPVAMVSMDNCSHNGDKLRASITTIAEKWVEGGFADQGFLAYIGDEAKISFPLSMIDKITPSPAVRVRELLEADGIAAMDVVKTSKNTHIAPFVNAEQAQYLVIEDKFPNGRPALEEVGVYFTNRETVDKVEKMKVCTCLNPLHTCLAVLGCLLGYTLIADELKDDALRGLIQKVGYQEGLPVVVNPGIIDPKTFIDEVMNIRFPNPNIPDTPQRIATDTSQKVAIRFGETIKAYNARAELNPADLVYIPLAIAGWCRYLLAVDDNLEPMTLSPDPMLESLQAYLKGITAGKGAEQPVHDALAPILSNVQVMGIDLYSVGLGEKIEDYFAQMLAGKGAVRATIEKYL
ncbi:mannitol dehydrogenase family protein [Oscillospiraceae bacterium MB08-C2-2]|nr:mannitol dehydrogenase family protein [Oscillospiraceae bacterium MB08-C2-2]